MEGGASAAVISYWLLVNGKGRQSPNFERRKAEGKDEGSVFTI